MITALLILAALAAPLVLPVVIVGPFLHVARRRRVRYERIEARARVGLLGTSWPDNFPE